MIRKKKTTSSYTTPFSNRDVGSEGGGTKKPNTCITVGGRGGGEGVRATVLTDTPPRPMSDQHPSAVADCGVVLVTSDDSCCANTGTAVDRFWSQYNQLIVGRLEYFGPYEWRRMA